MAAPTVLKPTADVEAFIQEYFQAWKGIDEGRILSYYDENVVLQVPGTVMNGIASVRDNFVHPFVTGFPGNRHIAKKMVTGQNVVAVEWSFEAEHTGEFAGLAATGASVQVPGCSVYEFDLARRKITAGRIYFDLTTLLRQVGAV